MKRLIFFIFAFLLGVGAYAQSNVQAKDITNTRYFIWQNDSSRTAATADSILGFVDGSDTATLIPIPAGGSGYWTQSGGFVYPTTATDNVWLKDSVLMSGLPTGTSDTVLYWSDDTIYKGLAPSGGSGDTSYWSRTQGHIYPATLTDSVGIGTSNPSAPFDVSGDAYIDGDVELTGKTTIGGNFILQGISNASVTDSVLYFHNDTVYRGPAPSGGSSYWELLGGGAELNPVSGVDTVNMESEVVQVDGAAFFTDQGDINNVIIGNGAAQTNAAHGTDNVGIGALALEDIASGGNDNTAVGDGAGKGITSGDANSYFGSAAGSSLTTGSHNTAIGFGAMQDATSAQYSVGIGEYTLKGNTGSFNTALGAQAGYTGDGSYCVFLGVNAGYSETGSNKLYIENSNSASPLIYGEFDNDLVRVNGRVEITNLPLLDSDTMLVMSNDSIGYAISTSGGGVQIDGNTNNYVLTATGKEDTIQGESAFIYSGGSASITSESAANFGLNYYTTTPGNHSQIVLSKYNGSVGSYAALDSADYMGSINFGGTESASFLQSAAYIQCIATEDWSTSANGNKIVFKTTADGGTSSTENLKLHNGVATITDVLKLEPRASAPSSPTEGMIYSNSSDNHLYFYNGTSWVQLDN